MSKTDPEELDPLLKAWLRAKLSAVRPPGSLPRYATAAPPIRAWRLAPVVLAIALTGILAVTAFAATGSPNPAVWANRVETVINRPSASPPAAAEPTESESQQAPAAALTHKPTAQPTERAEPTSSQERQSPEPSEDRSSPNPSPSPSGDH